MNGATGVQAGTAGGGAAPVSPEPGLSPLDWRVVALARMEADRIGASAFRARSAFGRLVDRLTGGERGVRRLADDRLEALRRFVGFARRRDRRAGAAAVALAALGLRSPTIELLRAAAVS